MYTGPVNPVIRVRRPAAVLLVMGIVAATVMASASAVPQRRRGGFGGFGGQPRSSDWVYDGAFMYCRGAYQRNPYGDGGGWLTDYPNADINLPWRTGQLTTVQISKDSRGEPNHVTLRLDDPNLFKCPMIIMTEPGSAYFDDADAAHLREYLDKGGFLWVDDFWGEYAWQVWEQQIAKVYPGVPVRDIPLDHPVFHMVYNVTKVPQIPSIDFWFNSGFQTSERGPDSAVPHIRGISDDRGVLKVVMTHNTDFGDAYEREGEDRRYFDRFAAEGYAFGVNVIVYAMTH